MLKNYKSFDKVYNVIPWCNLKFLNKLKLKVKIYYNLEKLLKKYFLTKVFLPFYIMPPAIYFAIMILYWGSSFEDYY